MRASVETWRGFSTGLLPTPAPTEAKELDCVKTLADDFKGTLVDMRASATKPVTRLDALRLMSPVPMPEKELAGLLKVLAPVNVLAVDSRGTLAERRASGSVPVVMLEAFSDVRPVPMPVKELNALVKVLAAENVLAALRKATEGGSRGSESVPDEMKSALMLVIWLPMPASMFEGLVI